MTPETPYITTHKLAVGYRSREQEHRLFEDLELKLYPNEMVCFMGPNGAGKSSLLRTLAGLQSPLVGRVSFHNEDPNLPRERQVAVVLTDRITAGHLKVEDVITFGRYPYMGWGVRLREADKQLIEDAVVKVGVSSLLKTPIYKLSDGQMQMVMIARALAQNTPVILLDEPTAHLDLNNRVEIMNLLRRLSRSGKAILLATHELDLALQTADRIWLTGMKRNIVSGLPEDLILKGTFDDIFQLKGFDLKSGKVLHHAYRGVSVDLQGEGPSYLWTRNALERNGFEVVRNESAEISITVRQEAGAIAWRLRKFNATEEFDSLEKIIKRL